MDDDINGSDFLNPSLTSIHDKCFRMSMVEEGGRSNTSSSVLDYVEQTVEPIQVCHVNASAGGQRESPKPSTSYDPYEGFMPNPAISSRPRQLELLSSSDTNVSVNMRPSRSRTRRKKATRARGKKSNPYNRDIGSNNQPSSSRSDYNRFRSATQNVDKTDGHPTSPNQSSPSFVIVRGAENSLSVPNSDNAPTRRQSPAHSLNSDRAPGRRQSPTHLHNNDRAPARRQSPDHLRNNDRAPTRRQSPDHLHNNDRAPARRQSPDHLHNNDRAPARRQSRDHLHNNDRAPARRQSPDHLHNNDRAPARRQSRDHLHNNDRAPARRQSPDHLRNNDRATARRQSPAHLHNNDRAPTRRQSPAHSPNSDRAPGRRQSPDNLHNNDRAPARRQSPDHLHNNDRAPARRQSPAHLHNNDRAPTRRQSPAHSPNSDRAPGRRQSPTHLHNNDRAPTRRQSPDHLHNNDRAPARRQSPAHSPNSDRAPGRRQPPTHLHNNDRAPTRRQSPTHLHNTGRAPARSQPQRPTHYCPLCNEFYYNDIFCNHSVLGRSDIEKSLSRKTQNVEEKHEPFGITVRNIGSNSTININTPKGPGKSYSDSRGHARQSEQPTYEQVRVLYSRDRRSRHDLDNQQTLSQSRLGTTSGVPFSMSSRAVQQPYSEDITYFRDDLSSQHTLNQSQLETRTGSSSNQRPVKQSYRVNIKMQQDKRTSDVTDICQLPNGTFAITDTRNKKVKFLNNDYEPVAYWRMPFLPQYICHVNGPELAVTLSDWSIRFVKTDDSDKCRGPLHLSHVCMGICHYRGKLYVSDWGSNVYVYNLNGAQIYSFSKTFINNQIFSRTRQISVNRVDGTLYVTDSDKGLVSVPRNKGTSARILSLEGAMGLCLGRSNRIYVCAQDSQNVTVIEVNSNRVLYTIDLIDYDTDEPKAICVDNTKHRLLISTPKCNSLTVIDID